MYIEFSIFDAATDEVNAVVLDLGTYQAKVGYAGDDTPKYVFPSVRQYPVMMMYELIPRGNCEKENV